MRRAQLLVVYYHSYIHIMFTCYTNVFLNDDSFSHTRLPQSMNSSQAADKSDKEIQTKEDIEFMHATCKRLGYAAITVSANIASKEKKWPQEDKKGISHA